MRSYIRHPTSIPIEVCAGNSAPMPMAVQNLSAGGLCFITEQSMRVGTVVEFAIPSVRPNYHSEGVVVWRREQSPHVFEVGLRFTSDDEFFRVRMAEQVCQIEAYRQLQQEQGRELSSEEAALEWIGRFAAEFTGEEKEF
jgi:hypothetical protein